MMEEKTLKILITGASRGIGLYLLKQFHAAGYSVYGTYSNTVPEEEYASFFTRVDIGSNEQVKQWVTNTVCTNDQLVLINCAGINYNVLARKAEVDKWKHLIDINLVGTFRAINAVLPYMYDSGYGRIINMSSIVAQKGVPGTSAYAASKAALWGMAKSIAVENAGKGITINNLNLGYYNAGMTLADVPADLLDEIKKQIPGHELGDPENIFKAILFLIDAAYVTGSSIDLNGGLF